MAVAVPLFTQHFPSVTVNPPPLLRPNCGVTASDLQAPGSVIGGSNVLFSCGTAGAVSVLNGIVSATPIFTLPTGYASNSLVLVLHGGTGCPTTGPTSGTALTSGTNVVLGVADYDYCATTVAVTASTALATFTIDWA